MMGRVKKLESEVQFLSDEEFASFRVWFDEARAKREGKRISEVAREALERYLAS